jgi:uncharacterized cupin superfamily protein
VVQPGKSSCPFHSHRGEEEMFFIVRGTGRCATAPRRARSARRLHLLPVGRPGDGAPDRERLDAELAYISVSTMMPAEVCEYPDSKKVGAYGGATPRACAT